MRKFALAIPTCWYLKMLDPQRKTKNLRFSVEYQWNIGCVGSLTQNSCVGYADFMLFIPGFFRDRYPTQTLVSVEYGH